MLVLYLATLLNSFLVIIVLWYIYGFSNTHKVLSSVKQNYFDSPFLTWMPFISKSGLTTLSRTSNTMLNKSHESGHHCLLPDLEGKAFSLLLLRMMSAVDFSYIAFIMLRWFPSIPSFLNAFI